MLVESNKLPGIKNIFADNLERLLKEQGMTQADLAREMGVEPQSITKAKKNNLSIERVDAIAEGLGVGADELLWSPPRTQNKEALLRLVLSLNVNNEAEAEIIERLFELFLVLRRSQVDLINKKRQ